jgi:hypothetical protein
MGEKELKNQNMTFFFTVKMSLQNKGKLLKTARENHQVSYIGTFIRNAKRHKLIE